MTNHSPAPWQRGQIIRDPRAGGDHVAFVGINDRNGVRIGTIGMVDVSPGQAEANLRLSLAAPELLAAVQEFIARRSSIFPNVRGADNCAALDRLEVAIEKATVRA